jgi:hypothetical protein
MQRASLSAPPPPPSRSLREAIGRAYRTRDRQVSEIIERCRRRSEHYRAFSGRDLWGLRRNTHHLVRGFYERGIVEGRAPTGAELAQPMQMARLRATQGVPLAQVIASHQIALPVIWRELVRCADSNRDAQAELLLRVPATLAGMSAVTSAVMRAYIDEHERWLRRRGEAAVELLDLVDPSSPHAAVFVERVLGALASAPPGDSDLETLRALVRSGFHQKSAALALGIHPHTLAYRVKQIRRRFDVDLDDAETRLRVQLALLILGA